ncbi:MAG: type III pantothenate kinase [Planctomycetota bacterium]
MTFLTVDLGNSRCKLRRWTLRPDRAPELLGAGDFASAPGLGSLISAWAGNGGSDEAAAVCSVAGRSLEDELALALGSVVSGSIDLRPDPGLAIACREPSSVGRDRLLGARAALELAAGNAIVVAVGTAMTVDAVRADRTFLGGAIAPGPALLAQALARGTARLPLVETRAGAPALGVDTQGAVRAGIAVGLRGAARELASRVGEEAGMPGATIVLTGGAREFLLDPLVFEERRVLVEPDLVHLGLLAARASSP